MISGFQTYHNYHAIKCHFISENYNAIKYNFKTKHTRQSFERDKTKHMFYKIAQRYKDVSRVRSYFLFNIVSGNDNIFNMRETALTQKSAYFDSVNYHYTQDLKLLYSLEPDLNVLFKDLKILELKEHVHIETLVYLSFVLNFITDTLNRLKQKEISDPMNLIYDYMMFLTKYAMFFNVESEKISKLRSISTKIYR